MKHDHTPQAIADKYITRDGKPVPRRRPGNEPIINGAFVDNLTKLSRDKRLTKFQRYVLRDALFVIRAVKDII